MKKQTLKKTEKSKMTLDKLALIMESGFVEQDKKTDKKIEGLAVIVQQGFAMQENKMEHGFTEQDRKTDKKIEDLAIMVKKGFDGVSGRLNYLEQGQEEIKLKLDNVAYRFELIELQRRVEFLEKKVGAR